MVKHKFRIQAIPTVIVLMVLQGAVTLARPENKNAEAKALFQSAYTGSNIQAKGSPPFRLRATFRYYKWNSAVVQGSFTELWIAPSRWKAVYSEPAGSDIYGVASNKKWRKSALPHSSFPHYLVDSAVYFNHALGLRLTAKVKRIKREKITGSKYFTCVVPSDHGINVFCFDPQAHNLVREIDRVWGVTLQFSDYKSWGKRSFPRKVQVFGHGRPIAQITVQELGPVGHINPSEFAPPPGARIEKPLSCAGIKTIKLIRAVAPRYPESAKREREGGVVLFYADIGKQGQVTELNVVHSLSPVLDAAAIQAVKQWRYEPPTCGGTPVEAIIPIQVHFQP